MIGYYTDPAVGIPDPKVSGGNPNRTSETFALDGKGRIIVTPSPEVPPPEVAGKIDTSFRADIGTGTVAKRAKQLASVPCYAVIIRNTTLGYIRVKKGPQYADDTAFDNGVDHNTIAPNFSKRILVLGDASALWIARDDGSATEVFVEATYELFVP
jgi:hypothetical protein